MTTPYDDDLPAGWLTRFRQGCVSGVAVVLTALAIVAAPCLLAWFLPGSSSSNPVSAVKAAGIIAVSGNHGGIVLNDTLVTLAPALTTVLLGWLLITYARRAQSSTHVVGQVFGYFVGTGLLARWAHLGQTYAPALRSAIAGLVFAIVVAGGTRAVVLYWSKFSDRYRRVLTAIGVGVAGYLGAAALVCAVTLLMHVSDAAALQRQIAGGVSGMAITLLAIAGTPNAVSAAVGYLTGPGFHVGTHTSVSILSVHQGPLPAFPLVAAIPSGSPAVVLGSVLAVVAALAVGYLMIRVLGPGERWSVTALDALMAVVGTALCLAAISMVCSGGLGSGALRHVGTSGAAVLGASLGCLIVGVGVNLASQRLNPVELVRSRPARFGPIRSASGSARFGRGGVPVDQDAPAPGDSRTAVAGDSRTAV